MTSVCSGQPRPPGVASLLSLLDHATVTQSTSETTPATTPATTPRTTGLTP